MDIQMAFGGGVMSDAMARSAKNRSTAPARIITFDRLIVTSTVPRGSSTAIGKPSRDWEGFHP
jgi:hypothetical protein